MGIAQRDSVEEMVKDERVALSFSVDVGEEEKEEEDEDEEEGRFVVCCCWVRACEEGERGGRISSF